MVERDNSKRRLEEAIERLEEALDKVNEKVAARSGGDEPAALNQTVELARLRSENHRLRLDLERTKQAYMNLEELTESVSDRLNATIVALSAMLEE